jgi:hypothetical protein
MVLLPPPVSLSPSKKPSGIRSRSLRPLRSSPVSMIDEFDPGRVTLTRRSRLSAGGAGREATTERRAKSTSATTERECMLMTRRGVRGEGE